MADIILYGPPQSSYVRTARMVCVEKGVAHDLRPVDLGSDAHRDLHPWAKVPVMEHESLRVYETAAICRFIDAKFPGAKLVPEDIANQAVMDQWISILDCYLYDDMIRNYALQYIFPRGPDNTPNREVIDPAVERMGKDLDQLDKALEGRDWISGSFSLADCFFGPVLMTVSLFPEGKQAIESRKNVAAYLGRLVERPSLREVTPPPPGS